MHHITDVESYNHYFGWYGGKMEQNGPWLDKFHAEHPDICIGISEYGTEGIINWHSNDPQCKDYTEEYQALYHEHLAQVFEDRPGCGLPTAGTCSTLAVLPATRRRCRPQQQGPDDH